MTTRQAELLALNQEFIGIVAEANSVRAIAEANGGSVSSTGGRAADLLFNPAELYGSAVAAMHGKRSSHAPDTDTNLSDDIARGIRMTAAKIRAGDRTYVIESLVGQAMWLQAMSLGLSDYTAKIDNVHRKVMLGNLVVKMQALAVRVLANLAGVSCLEPRV